MGRKFLSGIDLPDGSDVTLVEPGMVMLRPATTGPGADLGNGYLSVFADSGDAAESARLSAIEADPNLSFGPGGEDSTDLRARRSAAKTMTIDDGAGGAAVLDVIGEIRANGVAVGGGVHSIVAVFDGGLAAITGNPEVDVVVPAAGTLTGWTLLADAIGDAVIDIWKDGYANYPPTNADAMPGAGKEPTLSEALSAQDASITDWSSYAIAAGDILRFHLDSSSTVKRLELTLTYTRS